MSGKIWWDMRSNRGGDLKNNHCEEQETKPAKETSKIPRGPQREHAWGGTYRPKERGQGGNCVPSGHIHQGLQTLTLLAFGGVCVWGYPVHCRMFGLPWWLRW